MYILLLLLLCFLPTTTYVILGLSSLTLGYLVSLIISLFLLVISQRVKVSLIGFIWCCVAVIIIFFHGLDNYFTAPSKALGSILILTLMLHFANLFASYLVKLNDCEFKVIFLVIGRILFISGLFGTVFAFNLLGYERFAKSVFLFYEPSHYATIFGLILLSYLSVCDATERYVALIITIVIATILPSVTLLVYVLIFLLCFFSFLKGITLVFVTSVCFASYVIFLDPELAEYFVSRLVLNSENNNLSALVYMQGWADAAQSLSDTHGYGLGFLMAGQNEASAIGNKIFEIAGMYKNRDGSFIASKLIIEFGVIGIMLVISYVFFFIKYAFLFKNISSLKEKVLIGVVLSYSVEMFVRSNAYFAFGSTMFLIAIFSLLSINKKNSVLPVERHISD
jgi:hypothetical protein